MSCLFTFESVLFKEHFVFLISEGITFPSTAAPEFAPAPFNVSFLVGDLAVLTCRVYNLGTKKVIPWSMQYYIHEPNKNDLKYMCIITTINNIK